MDISVTPYNKNNYPRRGLFIKGSILADCLQSMHELKLSPKTTAVYPLPGIKADSVWGYFLTGSMPAKDVNIGPLHYAQSVSDRLFIPEFSILEPAMTADEIDRLFASNLHVFHPEFGWAELSAPLEWEWLVKLPGPANESSLADSLSNSVPAAIRRPADTIYMPTRINRFYIKELPPEEVLENLESTHFPKKESWKEGPLNLLEYIKLFFLRGLLGLLSIKGGLSGSKEGAKGNASGKGKNILPRENWLTRLLSPLLNKTDKLVDKWQDSLEKLEERNKKEVDRLLDLFKENPEEALKYAIPLDSDGTGRGAGQFGTLDLFSQKWGLSLFGGAGRSSGSGRGVLLGGDAFQTLRQQYIATAKTLESKGDYRNAAYIYLKLLKDYYAAAQALEQGGYFDEAAAVYLKYCNNKTKAAECYARGNMTGQAISIYKEIGDYEKVGDLYRTINQQKEALEAYEVVLESYTGKGQYIKASLLCKDKMSAHQRAQDLLLKGWREEKDALNCLQSYFANIPDDTLLEKEMRHIYHAETADNQKEQYLIVLRKEVARRPAVLETGKDLAYEIIADRIKDNPSISAELSGFNKSDKKLNGDIMRYQFQQKMK